MAKFDSYGGNFAPLGYMRINTGGSHDENPNGGVQVGVDPHGVPNLLEEDETVYNDYVYSDNIYIDKDMVEKHNLPKELAGKLYSEAADYFTTQIEGLENDPISLRGFNTNMVRLMEAQEEQKQLQQQKEIEEELSKMSPEEIAELDNMLSQQEMPQEAVPVEAMPEEVPVEQVPVEQVASEQIPVQQPMMCMGGTLLKRFDDGGSTDEKLYVSQSVIDPAVVVATDPAVEQFQRNINAGRNQFIYDAYDAYQKNPALRVVSEGMQLGAAPLLKGAAKEAVVSAAENAAYAGLAKEAAKTVGKEAAKKTAKKVVKETAEEVAKGAGKRGHWTQWFVDPKYYSRAGEKGFWKGAHDWGLGAVEAGGAMTMAGDGIGKIVELSNNRKGPVGDAFEDGFGSAVGGNKWAKGGNLYWPGGPFYQASESRIMDGVPHFWSINTGWGAQGPSGTGVLNTNNTVSNIGQSAGQYSGPFTQVGYRIIDGIPHQFSIDTGWGAFGDGVLRPEYRGTVTPQTKRTISSARRGNLLPIPNMPLPDARLSSAMGDVWNSGELKPVDNVAGMTGLATVKNRSGLADPSDLSLIPSINRAVVDNPGGGNLTTLPRYAGIVGNALFGLQNALTPPTKFTARHTEPVLPVGRLDLQPVTYNPTDVNQLQNQYNAQNVGLLRGLRNSGAGPSLGAQMVAANNAGTQNLGAGLLQVWDANNQHRNNVITANNGNAAQKANFDYTLDAARAQILNNHRRLMDADWLQLQQLNDAAETQKYQALSNQMSNVFQGLAGVGQENFAMNQINNNPALYYRVSPDGSMVYDPRFGWVSRKGNEASCGGFIKPYKG